MLLVKSDYNPKERTENGTDRFSAFWSEVADVKSASRNYVSEGTLPIKVSLVNLVAHLIARSALYVGNLKPKCGKSVRSVPFR